MNMIMRTSASRLAIMIHTGPEALRSYWFVPQHVYNLSQSICWAEPTLRSVSRDMNGSVLIGMGWSA